MEKASIAKEGDEEDEEDEERMAAGEILRIRVDGVDSIGNPRSFVALQQVDVGFARDEVLTMQVAVPTAIYEEGEQIPFYEQLSARVQALPGVRAVIGPQSTEGLEAIERIAAEIPDPGVEAKSLRFNRHLLLGDWTWHAFNFLGAPVFPHFRRHRPAHPLHELWGAAKKVAQWYPRHLRSKARLQAILDKGQAYFFFPLQLDQDFQLLVDSPFDSISEATDHVIASFARHAPADCLLLIKNHPHDSNLVDRERDTARIARRHGVADRVVFLETGSNPLILDHARGLVTINSTMGTSGLWHSLPVCVLGTAIYDLHGLTHQGELDDFWQAPPPPDIGFFRTFRRALVHATQARGEFGSGRSGEPTFQVCLYRLVVTPYRTAGLSLKETGDGSGRDPGLGHASDGPGAVAPQLRTGPQP